MTYLVCNKVSTSHTPWAHRSAWSGNPNWKPTPLPPLLICTLPLLYFSKKNTMNGGDEDGDEGKIKEDEE